VRSRSFTSAPLIFLTALQHCFLTACIAFFGLGRLLLLAVRPRAALAARNLFPRKQLTLFQERKVKQHRVDDSTRWMMATLSRMFQWRDALVNVKPDTLIRRHRRGFRLFWRWKSKPAGRPRPPKNLRRPVREMGAENPTWGEERIANELKLKLGIRVSPRTVEKHLRNGGPVRTPDPNQRWLHRFNVNCDIVWLNPFPMKNGHQDGQQNARPAGPHSRAGLGVRFGVHFSTKRGGLGGFQRL
jgi:hypothetical protein